MATILPFKKPDPPETPHRSGPAKCIHCKHEWIAVAPVGVTSFECPNCSLHKGVYRGLTGPEHGEIFICNCGNDYFLILRTGMLCVNCGEMAKGF